MASLYIHIPFCHHKCIYCGFYSLATQKDKDLYVDCLVKELSHKHNFIENVKTIYFGGGTPSVLTLDQVAKIMNAIAMYYDISNTEEITFELNSENATKQYLVGLKSLGINRLSIGVQSFDDTDLRLLNRSHTSIQSKQAISNALDVGFENISIDLISNLPFSSFDIWKTNLKTAVSFDIKHISCYTLMIDEDTMLERMIKNGKYVPVSEQRALEEFDYTMSFLEDNGFIHYETSSYSKPCYQSKHNTAYWTFEPYLGIGTSAHSFKKSIRCWNESNLEKYIACINNNDFNSFCQSEKLSLQERYEEYIMLSARMQKGLNGDYVQKTFSAFYDKFQRQVKRAIDNGYLNNNLSLTKKGWHLQDTLILELI